jgi:hypothetical protein
METLAEFGFTTFVSYEPALGPVDWAGWTFLRQLISGGESGPRPSHPDWHRAARDWCETHGIAYCFKQWGTWAPASPPLPIAGTCDDGRPVAWPDGTIAKGTYVDHGGQGLALYRAGKKTAGRLLDGVYHSSFPSVGDPP